MFFYLYIDRYYKISLKIGLIYLLLKIYFINIFNSFSKFIIIKKTL